jgi:surface protein
MALMFESCTSFNFDLDSWNVSGVTDMSGMLDNTGISTANYDSLLVGWSLLTLQNNVVFGVNGLIYTSGGAGATARESIETNYSWTFVGDNKT